MTDQQLVDGLRYLAAANGGTLSANYYEEARKASPWLHLPVTSTVIRRLGGTWNTALQRAGLPTRPAKRRAYSRSNKVECVARVWVALGREPTIRTYAAYRKQNPHLKLPSDAIIRRELGSWLAAVRLAEPLAREQLNDKT